MGNDSPSAEAAADESRGSAIGAVALGALLVVTVASVGCMDDGGPSGDPPAEGEAFTAREGLDAANTSAEDWSSEATLAGLTMIEQGGMPDEWPSEAFAYTPDGAVGDGQVPQWAYFYVDGDEQLAVYVNEAGEIFPQEDPPGQTPGEPLGDWPVDSDAAADAAREDENVTAILDADDAEVLYALQESDRGPVWWMRVQSEAMGEEQTMLVNAETGEARAIG